MDMSKARYYRVVLINKDTKERRMTVTQFTSRKKADEWATAFCEKIKNADYEIKQF
jgi:hypothetical protein